MIKVRKKQSPSSLVTNPIFNMIS